MGGEFGCHAQVRAFVSEVMNDGVPRQSLTVTLGEPLRGVAPGQTVVLYQGARVLGQATIDSARSLARPELP